MSQHFAQINFEIKDAHLYEEWESLIADAMFEDGNIEEFKISFDEKENIISVSFPISDQRFNLLEVGTAIGYINASVDSSEMEFIERWMSINDSDGNVIESVRDE